MPTDPPPLPPLPTVGVGSYAAPGWFIHANRAVREGAFGRHDAEELYEDATRIAIADQREAGLDIISDGEFSRQRFVFEMFQHLQGLERVPPARRLGIAGYDMAPSFVLAEGDRVSAPHGLHVVEEYRTLARLAPDARRKVALPGPLTFAGYIGTAGARVSHLLDTLTELLRAEVEGLVAAGADYVQLDEPGLAMQPHGLSLEDCAEAINAVVGGFGIRIGVHVCFGNNAGRPASPRDIERLMPGLAELEAQELSLEFANREMAQVELLAPLTERFDIAAGVVDVKSFHEETPEEVAARIERCLEHAPASRLRITADCGFSALPRWLARRKLRALVAGARLVRNRF
jgi:5-methyltetrahydropteroyltriglutamate--homocysteine methyltransferase